MDFGHFRAKLRKIWGLPYKYYLFFMYKYITQENEKMNE